MLTGEEILKCGLVVGLAPADFPENAQPHDQNGQHHAKRQESRRAAEGEVGVQKQAGHPRGQSVEKVFSTDWKDFETA